MTAKIKEMQAKYDNMDIEGFKNAIEDCSEVKKKLILDILTYGDEKVIELIMQ